MNRRNFIKQNAIAGLALSTTPSFNIITKRAGEFPVHQITTGKQHWFGYYDKWQVDPTGRYALGMEVDMIFRSPQPDDSLKIGLIDLEKGNKWQEIGSTKAWGWQQGCMLQWIPGSSEEVIWNDRQGDQFISRVLNVKTGKERILPRAIYALSPNGNYAIGTEFSRIQNMRPGYGYAGIPDPFENVKSPQDTGIYKTDLETGQTKLLINLQQVAQLPHQGQSLENFWHYFNHLLVNPNGERFIFLHRWREEMGERAKRATGGFVTRMFTADKNGDDLYVLDSSGRTSHFIWRDPQHVCAWTQPAGRKAAFYLFKDKTEEVHLVGEEFMKVNGHNTYVPNTNNEWILNDTYPYHDPEHKQTLYLYHIPTKKKVVLGRFFEPERFKGEWRCDLHPRCDQQGNRVFFDSTHNDGRRQMYMIDIEKVVRG